MTAFSGALGVVRVHLRSGEVVPSLPKPLFQARQLASNFRIRVARESDAAGLLEFETENGEDAWIRAREVDVVDVVATEDPGGGS